MTDSSTGGYIAPVAAGPAPLEDDALDDFLQAVVVGITGIPGKLVFPRWQQEPPNMPDPSTDWASIGITGLESEQNTFEAHDPILQLPTSLPAPSASYGFDIQISHEDMKVLASFYGPNAGRNASLLRDGLKIAQNREKMQLARIAFIDHGAITAAPSIVNNQWYTRKDIPLSFRREIVRYYPILDLASVQIQVGTDTGFTENIIIQE